MSEARRCPTKCAAGYYRLWGGAVLGWIWLRCEVCNNPKDDPSPKPNPYADNVEPQV